MTGIIKWSLLLVALWQCSKADEDDCPDDNAINPCYCTTDHIGYSYISCGRMSDMKRLKEILIAARGKNVSLGFDKTNFGDIPSDFFQGQIGVDIHFDHCKIGSFGSRPFSGMENTLKKIYIYSSVDKRIKNLASFPLGHLTKLHSLQFLANDIKELGNDWFADGPTSLEQVSLEANDIEKIGDTAFASLVNLQQLWLGDNRFKVVKRSMFPNIAAKLEILEMSFNGIESLPADIFTGMPKLHTINVSGNNLVTIHEDTWGNIFNQLQELYLERNYNLECDNRLKWIYQRKLPVIFSGRCYGTNSLRDKDLSDLTLEEFQ